MPFSPLLKGIVIYNKQKTPLNAFALLVIVV